MRRRRFGNEFLNEKKKKQEKMKQCLSKFMQFYRPTMHTYVYVHFEVKTFHAYILYLCTKI